MASPRKRGPRSKMPQWSAGRRTLGPAPSHGADHPGGAPRDGTRNPVLWRAATAGAGARNPKIGPRGVSQTPGASRRSIPSGLRGDANQNLGRKCAARTKSAVHHRDGSPHERQRNAGTPTPERVHPGFRFAHPGYGLRAGLPPSLAARRCRGNHQLQRGRRARTSPKGKHHE